MIRRFQAALVLFVTLLAASAHAQWLNHPSPGIPRTADGKPALNAPPPTTADRTIDLSGIWLRVATSRPEVGVPGVSNYSRYLEVGSAIVMLPAAAEKYRAIVAADGLGHPSEECLPKTFPNQILLPVPIQIVQTSGLTWMMFEEFNHFRQIDRRPQLST